LYEVDNAFHERLVKNKRLSREDLEELERNAVKLPQPRSPAADSLFSLLEKQKKLLDGKEIHIEPGKEGVLLTSKKAIRFLPTPGQLRHGDKEPQTIHEGVALHAQVHISADRRFVRVRFVEKSLEIDGSEEVKTVVDNKGTEALGEIVFPKEVTLSQI